MTAAHSSGGFPDVESGGSVTIHEAASVARYLQCTLPNATGNIPVDHSLTHPRNGGRSYLYGTTKGLFCSAVFL